MAATGLHVNATYYAQHPALKSVYGKSQSVIVGKLFSTYRIVFELAKLRTSSLFIDLVLKTSHYLYLKVLNERVLKWAHLTFYHKRFSRFEKEVIF